jgi:Flp pilus assembly protein TadD
MQTFEIDSKRKRLRTAISAIISTAILTGCGALTQKAPQESNNEQTDSGFCYNGGRTNEYSCDPEKATAQADMRTADIDEEWMSAKLSEVRSWLAEEKQAILNGEASPTDKKSTTPQEYITTVSISTPTPQQTSPEIAKILRLSQQGQHKAALTAIDKLIAENPNMAAAKLTKGIVTNQMGDKTSAKSIFTQLMAAYPDRPEAFNNLAVIYAEEGNFAQAIETLQQAFQTHPSYAQVHSNLKELYATLASQAYNKALDLGSIAASPELTMIDRVPSDISGNSSDQLLLVSNAATLSAPLQQQEANPAEVIPTLTKADVTKQSPNVIQTEKKATETAAISNKNQPPVNEPIIHEAEPEPTNHIVEALDTKLENQQVADQAVPSKAVSAPLASTEQEITQSLQNWAQVWSNKDYQGYINAYTPMYRPNVKLSHQQWVTQRQQRITKPKFIRIDVSNIQVKILGQDLAEVYFEQRYESDTYKDAVKKRVMMVNSNGQWKISLERSLGLIQ